MKYLIELFLNILCLSYLLNLTAQELSLYGSTTTGSQFDVDAEGPGKIDYCGKPMCN